MEKELEMSVELERIGSPKKWFQSTKSSNPSMIIKGKPVGPQSSDLKQNVKKLEIKQECREDKTILKEILKKSRWKRKKEEYLRES